MGKQRIEGDRNVQIQEVENSWIQVVINEAPPEILPLEPACLTLLSEHPSPARLISARADVFGYVDRAGLLVELEDWVDSPLPFAGQLIGGRGGSGKTRLAVELCLRLREQDWLCGFLSSEDDEARLNALVEVPMPRLVVIDYAENRTSQLNKLLPKLLASAGSEKPVRVLMLVRTVSAPSEEMTRRLGPIVQAVEQVIEGCGIRVLEEELLTPTERGRLFESARTGLARYRHAAPDPASTPDLEQKVFVSPLMVVIAAYLAAHGDQVPTNRIELLEGVLEHERRYWQEDAVGLGVDVVLLERLVAVATMLNAHSEEQAAGHLLLLGDLCEATPERRNRLARWVRDQYPGPRWWNPLEPDLVGEHLVAKCFADQPEVLRGAMARSDSEEITRLLEVLSRAAADHRELARALGPILGEELARLGGMAVSQAKSMKDADLLYGKAVTVAAGIDALLAVVKVDPGALSAAVDLMPPRADLVLNDLAATLTAREVERLRLLAEASPAYAPELAGSLNNLSNRLSDAGRLPEALAAIEESVAIRRPLAEAKPVTHAPGLAIALNNLSNRLSDAGGVLEALAAIEESVTIWRQLAETGPAAYAPELAGSLNNLSNRLSDAGRLPEALAAIEESVAIRRPLAEANSAAYAPDLAGSLRNLSVRLSDAGRHSEALAAIEESVAIFRRLTEENTAAHAPA